ncbi:MAG: Thioredoxin 1 [Chroococcidiopsis sp. SAG 2025]|uniref:thioredoxin family protein n=1 Tax=Chroococcidiopsis sp. SAG 2025 TaxID=171389 RepID=UPI0029374058|nr:thioredoxin domain-containing protein [Chroococcidiopsis sp. SAG 2025]MDV2992222.1 Thioredoxin 1 [Chroococcidiopsis sp. SAG 2025]
MSELTDRIFAEGRNALEQLQQESANPILVKFVAPHCPSCKTLAPVLEQLVGDRSGQIHLVTIDMTEDPELAIELGVRSAPTVVLLKGEEVVERIAGMKPKKVYAQAVQKAL